MSVVSETKNVLSSLARNESAETKETEDMQGRFLTLLTTQLRNQDPMNPMENAEVTSQLAQMSTVDGIERLNQMFQQFVSSQESSEAMQAAALVGRGVLVEGKGLILTEAGAVGGFVLDTPADKVVLTIRDANGLEVGQMELEDVEAGSHNFVWDGVAIDGQQAATGRYTVAVEATLGDEKVSAKTLEFGQVTGVIRGPKSTDLQVGSLGIFQFDDIKQIL
ncbi:flagellar hook assembly protein FlgD [Thauera sp. CAU 1555]|uniref:Basal-body rod modification protein FlgD n=1 Tax=Thauera sedimentorum TaxID=2767595 RepID=A0ABR9B5Q4_9RHOO|nr:flagellar hook assembly protein FlgD [Thauera sedimentorum]MBC9070787.1 flagellar hook assembly protein FlgD [Thauera sedimentorum]MBD8501706.1 flagellar hook assembly protein FlgD [Thauera sedimentorum]